MYRLSKLAELLTSDPEGTRKLLSVPALLSESPTLNSGPAWDRTSTFDRQIVATMVDPVVFLVTKQPGSNNPFSMGITLGRVPANDIPIDDSSISRFHAYFQKDERSGKWVLCDAESKNGTHVDDVKLVPGQREELTDGCQLRFGEVALRFIEPGSIIAKLREPR